MHMNHVFLEENKMVFEPKLNGYYDVGGNWVRTKYCFVDCGDRCDCKPPGGVYKKPARKAEGKKK